MAGPKPLPPTPDTEKKLRRCLKCGRMMWTDRCHRIHDACKPHVTSDMARPPRCRDEAAPIRCALGGALRNAMMPEED